MPRLNGRGVFGVLAIAAGFVAAVAPTPPPPDAQTRAVRLAGVDDASAADGGTAFVMGASGIPVPPPGYVAAVDTFYLQPHGFTGTAQSLFTPELYFPGNVSEVQGATILAQAIQHQIAGGHVDAANPVFVFGYSQSSAMSSLTMEELHQQGVPADDVHFVLVGNSANPNGGMVELLDIPAGSNLSFLNGLSVGHPTPDFFQTDVYTLEYDGFADFPRYPLNLLSDLNALAGIFLLHDTYLGLSPEQIADAMPLETTADDTTTHYYMIPTETLPLLDLLRTYPIIGNPLADLLEPDLRILVNLGYGSITDGWNQGPANVLQPFSFDLLPPDINWSDVSTALVNGVSQGVQAAFRDLQDPSNYQATAFLQQPPFSTLLTAAERVFLNIGNTANPASPTDPSDPPGLAADSGSSVPGSFGEPDSVADPSPQLLPIGDTIAGLDGVPPV